MSTFQLTLGLPRSESNKLIPRWGQKWPHKKNSYFLQILTKLDEIYRFKFQDSFTIFNDLILYICKLNMQINVCRKCIVFQNSALYYSYAAILKFEIYSFVSPSELFKLKLILIQVYA